MPSNPSPAPAAVPFAPAFPGAASRADAPPPNLPGEHFAAALAFWVCGGFGLVAVAPALAKGAFFLPQVVGVVHLFTLGWMILSIFGALCQFLPVAIGRPLRWRALAHATFGLQVAGVAIFTFALFFGYPGYVMAGGLAVSCAFVLFAVNLGATLISAEQRPLSWWALAGATIFLLVTPAYGLVLATNLNEGQLGGSRFQVLAVHAHVAIVGVVLLVIVGVAHRLLPMFLLSHGASERPARVSVALLFVGAALLALSMGDLRLAWWGGAACAAGVVAFLVQAVTFFRTAKRRKLDPGMRLAAVGLLGLTAALVLAPWALAKGMAAPRLLATYFALLLGAIAIFVAGHYYKIVPFIVWYHRFGPLVGKRRVPKIAELFSARVATVGGALLVAGWLGLVGSIAAGLPEVARCAAVAFTLGAVLETVMVARIARRRPA